MFGMTWLKDTIGTLVVLEMMWYSAVVGKETRNVNIDLNRFIDWVNNMAICKSTYDYYDIFSNNRVNL